MRLTSTAVSSGLSNATAAAEWITMSQPAISSRTGVVEAEAVDAHVTGHASDSLLAEAFELVGAQLVAQPVEDIVADDLPPDALLDTPAAGTHQQHHSTSGTQRKSRSTRAVPRNPVVPVIASRLPASASEITAVFYQTSPLFPSPPTLSAVGAAVLAAALIAFDGQVDQCLDELGVGEGPMPATVWGTC